MSNPNYKDWFEFILDFNLLERHLADNQLNPDPSGCSLIVQFLYHANMTEQVYNSYQTVPVKTDQTNESSNQALNNQVELKSKRIKILRVLAIKTAAILDWNLIKFEKEIPIAVMSDLLHIFLRLTMADNNEPKYHTQLDLDKLDNQTIFALQLLHRWCIRTVLFSKFPKKPPTKPVSVNMPGVLNPLQHMKDANENILKVITNNVQESVEFLEKFVKNLNRNAFKPISNCFKNINSESGTYDLVWENSYEIDIDEIRSYVSYDLGMYFFQQENYEKSLSYFQSVKEFQNKNIKLNEFNFYSNELDCYLVACKSMENMQIDETINNEKLINKNDLYSKKFINKIVLIENSIKNKNFSHLFDLLLEDNKTCHLSISYRLSLEMLIQRQQRFDNKEIILDQIFSCNLIRLVSESINYLNFNYNISNLNTIAKVISSTFDTLPQIFKSNLISFINLNFKKFNKQTQIDLFKYSQNNKHFNILIDNTSEKRNDLSKMDIDDQTNIDTSSTPSSPPPESSVINTINLKDNSVLTNAKLSLQTSDAIVLRNCINKYNHNNPSGGLRYFWPNWRSYNDSFHLPINPNLMNSLLKLNSLNDMDFFYISHSKINQLISLKNFEIAFKLLNSLESQFSSNQKLSKYFFNQSLYLNIRNFFNNYENLTLNSVEKQELIVKNCKLFLNTCKNDPEIPIDLMTNVLAFLLTVEEHNLLCSNEFNIISFSHHKKTLIPQTSPIFILFKTSKQISRLCLDMNKVDKNMLRKVARELWDNIVDIFTDQIAKRPDVTTPQTISNIPYDASNPSAGFFQTQTSTTTTTTTAGSQSSILVPRDQQILFQNRELIRKLFLLIKNKQVRTLIISILSTIFNIADTQANTEIYNELRHLWPSSLANAQILNLNSLTDLLLVLLNDSIENLNPFNTNWLRIYADILFIKNQLCDAMKYFLKIFVCDTRFFFRNKIILSGKGLKKAEERGELYDEKYMDDKMIRSMIKCCINLNKHTQAALLCQCLSNNNDYGAAFRYLQDSSMLMISMDDMDMLYACVWDMALLEYLANLNYQRGFLNKKNLCIKLIASQNINASNPADVYQKTVDSKKSNLFLSLINYYFL